MLVVLRALNMDRITEGFLRCALERGHTVHVALEHARKAGPTTEGRACSTCSPASTRSFSYDALPRRDERVAVSGHEAALRDRLRALLRARVRGSRDPSQAGPQPGAVVRAASRRAAVCCGSAPLRRAFDRFLRAVERRMPVSEQSLAMIREFEPDVVARLALDRDRLPAGRPPPRRRQARDPDRSGGVELGQPDHEGRDPRRARPDDRLERGSGPGGGRAPRPARRQRRRHRRAQPRPLVRLAAGHRRGGRSQPRSGSRRTGRSCSTSARRASSPATTRWRSCASGSSASLPAATRSSSRSGCSSARIRRTSGAGATPTSTSPGGSSSGRGAAWRRPTARARRTTSTRSTTRRRWSGSTRARWSTARSSAGPCSRWSASSSAAPRPARSTSPTWRARRATACSTSPSRGTSTSSSSAPRCAPRTAIASRSTASCAPSSALTASTSRPPRWRSDAIARAAARREGAGRREGGLGALDGRRDRVGARATAPAARMAPACARCAGGCTGGAASALALRAQASPAASSAGQRRTGRAAARRRAGQQSRGKRGASRASRARTGDRREACSRPRRRRRRSCAMIPRILHHIWIGPDPLPDDQRPWIESWKRHHPDWEHRLWTEENLPEDPVRPEILERLRAPVERADILRLEILYRHGGVYLDGDLECLRPIDDVLEGQDFVGVCHKPGRITNTAIAAVPGHPLLERALERGQPDGDVLDRRVGAAEGGRRAAAAGAARARLSRRSSCSSRRSSSPRRRRSAKTRSPCTTWRASGTTPPRCARRCSEPRSGSRGRR